MTQSTPKFKADLATVAQIILDRYDELREGRTYAPEMEMLRLALQSNAAHSQQQLTDAGTNCLSREADQSSASAALNAAHIEQSYQPSPVQILTQALQRICLNIYGDHPAQNIAGDALEQYNKVSSNLPQIAQAGLLAELDWCIKEGCNGPRSHAALLAARASISNRRIASGVELVGMIVGDAPVHGWHMEAFKPWDHIGAGTRLYALVATDNKKDRMPHPSDEQWFSVQITASGDDDTTARETVEHALRSAHNNGYPITWNSPVPCAVPDEDREGGSHGAR